MIKLPKTIKMVITDFDGIVTDNLVLYAQWARNRYIVKFDSNGGIGTMNDQIFETGVEQSLNGNQFTKEGFEFNFWNTRRDGSGTIYTDQQNVLNITDGSEITLYAQWREEFEYGFIPTITPLPLKFK